MKRMVDYLIVGGGTGGCTVAGRLSEDSAATVEILEEGPSDSNPYIHLPVTYYKTAKGALLNRYRYQRSEAQTPQDNPTMIQARVLGGGSSVNAMIYVRGVPADYDEWVSLGATGWGYRDVLPYFKRAEGNESFAGEVHGTDGPLGVSDQNHPHPLSRVWLQACQQAGLPFNPDFNSGDQNGCGFYQVTTRRGRRSSAAVAYLGDRKRRPNLTVNTGCRVRRVLFEGKRAVGVEYERRGQRETVFANREIIVCAGAFNTPKLLMQSGIGAEGHLRQHGIDVVSNLPGVGSNYQDHMEMSLVYKLNGEHSYDKYKKLRWQLWAGLEYALFRSGPVTSNVIETGAFWRSNERSTLPDLQLFFLAGAGVEEGVDSVPGGNGCTISVTQTRPRSRGYVELTSADPHAPPKIVPNYLTDPIDLQVMASGAKLVQDILDRPAFKPFLTGSHVPPARLESAAALEAFVRREAHPGLHPCGTCRMGMDNMAVVDPHLRVRGVEGLRIADASVMPNVISGNLNAVVNMIGERASDLVRGNRCSPTIADPATPD